MRGNDHHTLLGIVRIAQGIQSALRRQAAVPSAQLQRAGRQGRALTGQIEEAPPLHTTLEVLAIGADQYLRIEPAPQPGRVHPQFENQGIGCATVALDSQATIDPMRRQGLRSGEVVVVVIIRRIEQVIGEPGLVSNPAQHQRHWRHCRDAAVLGRA